MIETICLNIFLVGLFCSQGGDNIGYASWYESDWIMDETIKLRQSWGQLPQDLSQWDGFAATISCDLIGETVKTRVLPIGKHSSKGENEWLDILITDCSGHLSTTTWMGLNDIKLEFGARTAKKMGIHRVTGVPIEAVLMVSANPELAWIVDRLVQFEERFDRQFALADR